MNEEEETLPAPQTLIEAVRALDDAREVLRGMTGWDMVVTTLGPAENNRNVAFESETYLLLLVEKLREAGHPELARRVPKPIEKVAGYFFIGGVRAREMMRAGKMCLQLEELRADLEVLVPGALPEATPNRFFDAEGWAKTVRAPWFYVLVAIWNIAVLWGFYTYMSTW